MYPRFLSILWALVICYVCGEGKQGTQGRTTLYEYYTADGVQSGLQALPDGFVLNGRNITILGGAIHYFRVHPDYWRDRLRKLRAMGFTSVDTYIPWNLHEPEIDVFDFGDGDRDFSLFLDVVKFVKMAQEEDLFVVLRPGPFISAEWEWGGLPSWLMRDSKVRIRTWEPHYIRRMTKYFNKLFPLLKDLQFTSGGPIIAIQIENEYGYARWKNQTYLEEIKRLMEVNGLTALKFTTDTPLYVGANGSLPGVLMTANFNTNPEGQLGRLKELQPDMPCWVMEYWTGWFDNWFGKHQTTSVEVYVDVLEQILKFPSSVHLYMFHGGTTFGFMNGANVADTFPTLVPIVTSYDYDAPLTEAGDYTEKYNATRELVKKYLAVETKLPDPPPESVKLAYPTTPVTAWLTLAELVAQLGEDDRATVPDVVAMEMLDVNNKSGQGYGFVLYRKTGLDIPSEASITIEGHVRDLAILMVDGRRQTDSQLQLLQQLRNFGYWEAGNASLTLGPETAGSNKTLDILVESWGHGELKKGLWEGPVLLNSQPVLGWEVASLQFKRKWLQSLTGWQSVSQTAGPTLYRAILNISTPHDTFIDMSLWGKGNVFVNGFNMGRYFSVGPTHTMYVPAPFLHEGTNEVLVFELFAASSSLVFSDVPILG